MYSKSLEQLMNDIKTKETNELCNLLIQGSSNNEQNCPNQVEQILEIFSLYLDDVPNDGNGGPTSIMKLIKNRQGGGDVLETEILELRQNASIIAAEKNYKGFDKIAISQYQISVEELQFFARAVNKVIICICEVYGTIHVMLLCQHGHDYLYSSVSGQKETSVFGNILRNSEKVLEAFQPEQLQKIVNMAYNDPLFVVLRNHHYQPVMMRQKLQKVGGGEDDSTD